MPSMVVVVSLFMSPRWLSGCYWQTCTKLSFSCNSTLQSYGTDVPSSYLGKCVQTIHSRSTQAPVSASLEWDDKAENHLEQRKIDSQQKPSFSTDKESQSLSHPPPVNGESRLRAMDKFSQQLPDAYHSDQSSYTNWSSGNIPSSDAALSSTNGDRHSDPHRNSIDCQNLSCTTTISLSTTYSNSSQSVLSTLDKFRGQQTESSGLAKFIAHESGKYYDFSKSYRHIRQENAYVHAFLKTRMDCPNTSVILPETVGNDRVFRFKERNVANLFDGKAVVNKESSLHGGSVDSYVSNNNNNTSNDTSSGGGSNNGTSSGSNNLTSGGSGGGRKKNPPGRLITQRILEEEADQKEKTQKEFEEKVRDVLKRNGKFSLDDETAKQLIKEYSSKKLASGQMATFKWTSEEKSTESTTAEEEQQLYPTEIPKNKKQDILETTAQDEQRARLKQLESKPNFTNLVDISQLVQVFPQDHWSAEQVKRLSLFIQQTHGLSATTRLERLMKFIHQLNEEVRKSQQEKPMLETKKRTRGRKPFRESSTSKKQTATRKTKQGKK